MAFSALGRTSDARRELDLLDEVAKGLTSEWKMGNNPAADVMAIARAMAEGELAYREGRTERAFELLRTAVELEEKLAYDEPPGWMQPVRHALGALLLADGRHAEAEDVYRADLHRHPNNAWSLLGLQQSLQKQGKEGEAAALAEAVRQAWRGRTFPRWPAATATPKPASRRTPTVATKLRVAEFRAEALLSIGT